MSVRRFGWRVIRNGKRVQASIVCPYYTTAARVLLLIPDISTTLSKIPLGPLTILVPAFWRFLPEGILTILDKVPNKESKVLRKYRSVAKATARQTISNVVRDNSRDIVTLLGLFSLIVFIYPTTTTNSWSFR